MSVEIPCLSLAIAPLRAAQQFAVHVIRAPYAGGYVLHDTVWSSAITQLWRTWQEMFSTRSLPEVPHISSIGSPPPDLVLPLKLDAVTTSPPVGRAGLLMQSLGISLWQWLFDGSIQASLNHSQGIAMGMKRPLRLRLEIRDPDLTGLPWEIMQDGAGKQAISLSPHILFSRTSSDVGALPPLRTDHSLRILLVLGQDSDPMTTTVYHPLQLEQEAIALTSVLKTSGTTGLNPATTTPCQVDTLVQPTPSDLIAALERQSYNVFFYAGHGIPAPNGGLLFLRSDMTLNGTELAQVLTRCQVKLAVFNACWGAEPDHYIDADSAVLPAPTPSRSIPRSSLAEVLIHHGVPAVLGMRDSIADEEALSFIQAFAGALAECLPIDRAVAISRQHLLTLYKYNHQSWTLPVLYMHPEFDGELLKPRIEENLTRLPFPITRMGQSAPAASLRSLFNDRVWKIQGGIVRVGRDKAENDLILHEDHGGISRKHAVIFCRSSDESDGGSNFFLEDCSSYGTWVQTGRGWQKVHRQEVPLFSGMQLKFGSSQNEAFEFIVEP
ncbi:MAG: CHAT domain-containing protein [Leptolyngbyaceae cyanobacterium]